MISVSEGFGTANPNDIDLPRVIAPSRTEFQYL
ncbi:protein of unknown function [Pararobbsia alpina]